MVCYTEKLPPELIHKVFSFLLVRDLGRASMVCKRWRAIANSESLWKKICEEEDVFEEYIDTRTIVGARENSLEPFNKWAFLYSTYLQTVLNNWKNDIFTEFELPPGTEHVVIDGIWMVQSFFNRRTLDVYKLENKAFIKTQTINPKIPGDGGLCLRLGAGSLTISSNNIVTVYNLVDNQFVFEMVIANDDSNRTFCTTANPEAFISQHFSDYLISESVAIFKNYVWIVGRNNFDGIFIVINRKNGTIKEIKTIIYESFVSNSVCKDKFIILSETSASVFLSNGEKEFHWEKESNFSYPIKITTSLCHQYSCLIDSSETTNRITAINNQTGDVGNIEYGHPVSILVNEKTSCLYVVNYVPNKYCLKTYSLPSGECVWSEELRFPNLRGKPVMMTLHIVLNRFLLICPDSLTMQFCLVTDLVNKRVWPMSSKLIGQIKVCREMFLMYRSISYRGRRYKFMLRSYL